ncbi:MAG: HyaD/HybD family hydrogenase maturation endopeptidase [Sulfurovum sp.]|nr:HyaD/HybD family hydrogenase maturation endopeptidase [Sulfurovum sp.]
MKILILGIGNVLFGDEGVGAHLSNLIEEKYDFISDEHQVDVIDGGTLAQRLIPIITDGYDRVLLIDCVNVDDGDIGDVYCFDFDKVPDYITWNGSAHEVEMLQTLQMIELMGDLPPVKIVGVVPYVIGEDTTFSMTDEVVAATLTMEKAIIDYIKDFGIDVKIKQDIQIRDVSENTYIKGFDACY